MIAFIVLADQIWNSKTKILINKKTTFQIYLFNWHDYFMQASNKGNAGLRDHLRKTLGNIEKALKVGIMFVLNHASMKM